MRVFAVVVNWNGGEANVECLDSLAADGIPPEQVVFVDNASSDGSAERVRERFPGVLFVANERNEGFGHGTNQGVRRALEEGAEAVFLVNNDVVLPEGVTAALARALDPAEDGGTGIVGPRVVFRDRPDVIWAAGGLLTFRQNLTTLCGHLGPDGPGWQRTREVDYVAGCAMLVARQVFERVGLLDGDYFAYHEDVDFCLRASQAGYRILCVGEVRALHDAHASTGGGYNPRRKYMMGVNTIWFLRKHGSAARWTRFAVFDVLSLPFVWAREALRGRGKAALAKGLGMWHGARGRRVTAEAIRPGASRLW